MKLTDLLKIKKPEISEEALDAYVSEEIENDED